MTTQVQSDPDEQDDQPVQGGLDREGSAERSVTQSASQDKAVPFLRSMRGRLSTWFLLLSFLPLAIVGVLGNQKVQNSLEQRATDQLVAVREIKAHQVEAFFEERVRDMRRLARTRAKNSATPKGLTT